MRIACIHVPQFALQCATRLDPSLRGAPVAVVSGVEPGRERAGVLHAPVVLACSRAAWARGVRLGMTAVTARSQSDELAIVSADSAAERETTRAIADAVLAVSATVDVGGRVGAGGAHLAMYCEVPGKTRGTSFGDKLVELLAELGVSARIGIADDRFTAWVAAAYGPAKSKASSPAKAGQMDVGGGHDHQDTAVHGIRSAQGASDTRGLGGSGGDPLGSLVVSVPRGGSAAFLAPRPLSLLAIPAEVQHMLESLGVTTLGEFAALPAPSVARPFEADYQSLARGESGATLRLYHPDAPIREEIVVSASTVLELPGSLSGPAAIAQMSRRLALRLAGRDRGAARLDVAMLANDGDVREVPVTIDGAVMDAEEIARVLAPVLDTVQEDMPQLATQGGWRLRVVVPGEAVVGGDTVEVFAEGSSPVSIVASARPASGERPARERAFGERSAERRGSVHAAGIPNPSLPLFPPPRMPGREAANGNASEEPQTRFDAYQADPDPLTVVLSSSASLFSLSPPSVTSERRDVHRRTRRGKQRRTRPTPQVQSRLFDQRGSK